jgi:2-polyprenyl-3-methyl-5-hydroxy-6-metoxy-1,4-benzoquinol methylase
MYLQYVGFFDKIRNYYFCKLIEKYLRKGQTLLDFGCGPGDMLLQCKKYGVNAFGIDNSERSVKMAESRGLHVELGNVEAVLRLNEQQFDVIFLQSVLEHVEQPIGLLQKLDQHLKVDGHFIISAPTPGHTFWDDPTHVRPYTPKSFRVVGELMNYQTIQINYVFAFLLGLQLESDYFYRIMSFLNLHFGTNIIGVYKKQKTKNDKVIRA